MMKLGIKTGNYTTATYHKMDREHAKLSMKRAQELEKKNEYLHGREEKHKRKHT